MVEYSRNRCSSNGTPAHLEPLPAPIDLGEKSEPTVRESAIAGGSLRNVNEQKFL
jgi:hypothetical protein